MSRRLVGWAVTLGLLAFPIGCPPIPDDSPVPPQQTAEPEPAVRADPPQSPEPPAQGPPRISPDWPIPEPHEVRPIDVSAFDLMVHGRLYWADTPDVWVADVAGATESLTMSSGTSLPRGVADLTWSPDGARLLFEAGVEGDPYLGGGYRKVYVYDSIVGAGRLFELDAWSSRWSPDSAHIAFRTGASLFVTSDGGATRTNISGTLVSRGGVQPAVA